MNKKQYSMIAGFSVALALAAIVMISTEQSTVLSIDLIVPTESIRPAPPSITLGEHGQQVSLSSVEAKISDTSKISMNGKYVSLVDVRQKGTSTYEYYGAGNISDTTTLTEFMKLGGIVVKTYELRKPTVSYTTLANHEDTKNDWFIHNGLLAFAYPAHASQVPTQVNLYTDDGKMISVWTFATVEDTLKIAEKLELQSGLIDLNDYVDPKWTDGPEIVMAEPEPIPEPES